MLFMIFKKEKIKAKSHYLFVVIVIIDSRNAFIDHTDEYH